MSAPRTTRYAAGKGPARLAEAGLVGEPSPAYARAVPPDDKDSAVAAFDDPRRLV